MLCDDRWDKGSYPGIASKHSWSESIMIKLNKPAHFSGKSSWPKDSLAQQYLQKSPIPIEIKTYISLYLWLFTRVFCKSQSLRIWSLYEIAKKLKATVNSMLHFMLEEKAQAN